MNYLDDALPFAFGALGGFAANCLSEAVIEPIIPLSQYNLFPTEWLPTIEGSDAKVTNWDVFIAGSPWIYNYFYANNLSMSFMIGWSACVLALPFGTKVFNKIF
jgi:hypothetical protein